MARIARRRRAHPATADGVISALARVDRRTKNLLTRLQPGEIAVIDHEDIDRLSAEGLIQSQAAAVVNAARSSSGRYPNLGALLLCSAGVRVVDDAGPGVMSVPDGSVLQLEDGKVFRVAGGRRLEVGEGRLLSREEVEATLDDAKRGIAAEIERFAENTMQYIRTERDVLIEAARLPEVRTNFYGRHVLIVVRGHDYKEDLAHLRSYIREVRPLLVGVDGGADALLDFDLTPDMIIGDMDSVTSDALQCGAELVVHAYSGGEAPGLARVQALELPHVVFEATGTSEDIAMLLAFEQGAELIVAVGTHANLIEFLDKGRKGMASTFLTRLRVGPVLVDAKGVSRLYRSATVRRRDLLLLLGAAFIALAVAIWASPPLRLAFRHMLIDLEDLWFSIRQALG